MSVTTAPAPASVFSHLDRLKTPRGLIALILLMWLPLATYVLFGRRLGWAQDLVLLPAIPAVIMLYVIGVRAWAESTVAVIGLTLVFFWLLMAVTAPYLPLIDPNRPIAPFQLPGTTVGEHTFWLGSDMRGRDILSRAIWGCQRVLVWGVTATLCAYVVGTVFGLVAGYLSGWWDEIISFFANVLLSFPVMVLFILVLNYLGQSGVNIVIAVTFASAPAIMRIVRGLTLDIKTRDYVYVADAMRVDSVAVESMGRAATIACAMRRARGSSPYWRMIRASSVTSELFTISAAVYGASGPIRMSRGPSLW
jgi:peptide/nickel transport system permease protein